MRYQKLNRFSDSEFKRLVGVPRQVFTEMVEVLEKAGIHIQDTEREYFFFSYNITYVEPVRSV